MRALRAGKARALDPFRVAQALPSPQKRRSRPPGVAREAAGPGHARLHRRRRRRPRPRPRRGLPRRPRRPPQPCYGRRARRRKACQRDEDCPEGNICQASVCQTIELSTNLFPIYYREGSFKEIVLVYWSRKGNPGYTVAFPFYWHFYSPTTDALLVVPFFWHFDRQRPRLRPEGRPQRLLEQRARRALVRDLAAVLRVEQVRLGDPASWLTFNVGDSDRPAASTARSPASTGGSAPRRGRSTSASCRPSSRRATPRARSPGSLPLNFYWRNGNDRNLLALPLFYKNGHKTGNSVYTWLGYSKREGLEQSGSALWLYWYGKDDADKSRYDVLFPLLWSFRTGESRSTVFFPLLWSFSSAEVEHHRRRSAVPRLPQRQLVLQDACSPLWWSGGDVDTGRSFKLLLPLFFWQQDAKAGTSTLVTPARRLHPRRHRRHLSRGFILPLLTYWHREPQSEFNFVTPLYVSHYSKTNHSTTRR